ncbi:PKD domain-containing protein [Cupriavidus sp. BIC8F]|uniref:PKD domain-containing protein n=1 Tax=Cupriavidus sp. BIC8F TaxID=3079014 RepID=UPI0039671F31
MAGTIVLEGLSVPIANAGANREGEVGDLVVLDGRRSYAPASPQKPLSYVWSQLSGPATVTLTGVTTVSPSLTPSVPGVYVFSLVVSDDNVRSTPSTVQVNVLPADGGCLGCNPFSK